VKTSRSVVYSILHAEQPRVGVLGGLCERLTLSSVAMSAYGTKRTSGDVGALSANDPKRTLIGALPDKFLPFGSLEHFRALVRLSRAFA
jgi:hypothetical protein